LLNYDIKRLVFLDESGADLHTIKLYGWGLKKKRLLSKRYSAQGIRVSCISAISIEEIKGSMTYTGTLDIGLLGAYIKDILLCNLRPGYHIIVMDNLRAHKNKHILKLFEDAKIEVILQPPYSPEFNRIENAWSQMKSNIKKYFLNCTEDCFAAWAKALDKISINNLENYFNTAREVWISHSI
jgi:transposase